MKSKRIYFLWDPDKKEWVGDVASYTLIARVAPFPSKKAALAHRAYLRSEWGIRSDLVAFVREGA